MDVSVGWVLKGLQLLPLMLWLLRDMCCTVSLHQSIRQWQGQLQHLQQKFTSNAGKNELDGVLKEVVPYNAICVPKLADFWLIYLVMDYLGAILVFIILHFLLF